MFCACFWSYFAWIAVGFGLVLAFALHNETKVIGLLLFFYCFNRVLDVNLTINIAFTSSNLILSALKFLVCLLYFIRVIRKEKKLNWKILIPVGAFLVYAILPFHECSWKDAIGLILFFGLLYVVFEEKREINFKFIVRIFVLGLIISCIFGLFKPFSPLLNEKIPTMVPYGYTKVRFQGLISHPNQLAALIVIAICASLILKFKGRISFIESFAFFKPLFIFGYLTLSRVFVLTTAIALAVFGVFYLIKYKVKAFPLLCSFLVVIGLVAVIFLGETNNYLQRIDDSGDYTEGEFDPDNLPWESEEWLSGVFEGKIYFDPGRTGLYKMYLKDWSSSTKTILFGRGISRPLIGQISAHNLFIQELWEHGVIGYFLYAVIILCTVNWKKLKQIRPYLSILIILIPYLLINLVEPHPRDYVSILIVLVALGFLSQSSFDDKQD